MEVSVWLATVSTRLARLSSEHITVRYCVQGIHGI